MESACDKHTGQIIDAEQLWVLDFVDPLGYECRGCEALATPCSYRPENKVRPYFSAKGGHKIGCNVEGEVELVKSAKKQSVTTREGFPGSFPNRLVLQDARLIASSNEALKTVISTKYRQADSGSSVKNQRQYQWTAETIRPICRTFINYPFDRYLPLSVPDIAAKTYSSVFRSLKSDQIIRYPQLQFFYAPLSWTPPTINHDHLEIQLSYGHWENKKLTVPYQVKVNWKNWSIAKRNYVSREIEIARLESIAAKKGGEKSKGFLFFVGTQDENNPALFHIDDHRLICCLVAEIIYPQWSPR
jgi:hypothetical protein